VRLAPGALTRLLFRQGVAEPITLEQRVRHRITLDNRKADEVSEPRQLAAQPLLDARDAEVVIRAKPELVLPDAEGQQAVIADLDHVNAAVVAATPRDLAATLNIAGSVGFCPPQLPLHIADDATDDAGTTRGGRTITKTGATAQPSAPYPKTGNTVLPQRGPLNTFSR